MPRREQWDRTKEWGDLRDILYPVLIFNHLPYVIRKLTRDFDGVEPRDVAIEALPLGDPALAGVGEGDDALEDLGGAALDLVLGAGEVEEFFAVGAAFVAESLKLGDLCVSLGPRSIIKQDYHLLLFVSVPCVPCLFTGRCHSVDGPWHDEREKRSKGGRESAKEARRGLRCMS